VEPDRFRILRLDPLRPDPGPVGEAAAALTRGGLVIVPTETVYGLAADPRFPGAGTAIYAAKGRPDHKPVTLFAADVEQVKARGAVLGPAGEKLARAFWPGPLTLVVKTPDGFTGFRVPDHAVPLALLRKVGSVLAVTSANRSGELPAVTAETAAAALGSKVEMILDAGPSPGGVPSTVVRVDGDEVQVLRDGAISEGEIRRVVGGSPSLS
jgi:L-threonylcarbamoyladenylate synthase